MKLAVAKALIVIAVASTPLAAWAGEYRQSDVERERLLLQSSDASVRNQAAYHLSEMGAMAKAAVPDLTAQLADQGVAGAAASALGKIGPAAKTAVPALIGYLSNPQAGYDRAYAATAVGSIGQDPDICVPALMQAVKDAPEPVVRRLSASSLGCFNRDARCATSLLIEQIKSGDKDMRRCASEAIGKIGGQASDIAALNDLLKDEIDDARLGAAKALGHMGSEAVVAVPNLITLLQDPAEDIRLAAAETLGSIGPDASSAVPALKAILTSGGGGGTFLQHTTEDALEKIAGNTAGGAPSN